MIITRTCRGASEQAALGEDAEWCHGAFATNTVGGQIQWLDARHRTQAHVEDRIKELRAMGAEKLPTADAGRNAAWLQLAALAVTVTACLRHLALDGDLKQAEPKTLRFRILAVPARLVQHARYLIVKVPDGWGPFGIVESLGRWSGGVEGLEPVPGVDEIVGPVPARRSETGSPGARVSARPPTQQSFHDQQRTDQRTRHLHESSRYDSAQVEIGDSALDCRHWLH